MAKTTITTLNAHAQTWLDSRTAMSSNYDERLRWNHHLSPYLGHLDPDQVNVPVLKKTICTLRAKGLAKSSVGLCVRLLSSLYGDLVEDGCARQNPTRLLSKKTRVAELKTDHDPQKTPFVKDPNDITRIYQYLRPRYEAVATAYAIGALAGLRTGEVRALAWEHVDLERKLIHVQVQVERRRGRASVSPTGLSVPKDDDSRWVPISDSLFPILKELHRGTGLVCLAAGGAAADPRRRFVGEKALGDLLAAALAELKIETMTFYQATRHSFASQWVLHGGSLEKLREILGHSSVTTTERYVHLTPGRFTDEDRARVRVDLTGGIHDQS